MCRVEMTSVDCAGRALTIIQSREHTCLSSRWKSSRVGVFLHCLTTSSPCLKTERKAISFLKPPRYQHSAAWRPGGLGLGCRGITPRELLRLQGARLFKPVQVRWVGKHVDQLYALQITSGEADRPINDVHFDKRRPRPRCDISTQGSKRERPNSRRRDVC